MNDTPNDAYFLKPGYRPEELASFCIEVPQDLMLDECLLQTLDDIVDAADSESLDGTMMGFTVLGEDKKLSGMVWVKYSWAPTHAGRRAKRAAFEEAAKILGGIIKEDNSVAIPQKLGGPNNEVRGTEPSDEEPLSMANLGGVKIPEPGEGPTTTANDRGVKFKDVEPRTKGIAGAILLEDATEDLEDALSDLVDLDEDYLPECEPEEPPAQPDIIIPHPLLFVLTSALRHSTAIQLSLSGLLTQARADIEELQEAVEKLLAEGKTLRVSVEDYTL